MLSGDSHCCFLPGKSVGSREDEDYKVSVSHGSGLMNHPFGVMDYCVSLVTQLAQDSVKTTM